LKNTKGNCNKEEKQEEDNLIFTSQISTYFLIINFLVVSN